ncbi:MAG: Dabb family protein [Bacteroidota bacterium]|nr:Dabb family protein [Bacteroidota bacterium]
MIHHIVMWKLKDFAEGNFKNDNAKIIKQKLEELRIKIEVIKKLEVGINMSTSQYANFDIVLDSYFDSYEKMEIYQKHPLHIEVSDWIGKVRETRAAVDFEI